MTKDERKADTQAAGPGDRRAGPPVAAVLFEPSARPTVDDLIALSRTSGQFAITDSDAPAGLAELMCDGLGFDCAGLAPGKPLVMDGALQRFGLPDAFAPADHALITLCAAPYLGTAAQELPVVRIMTGLIVALTALPQARAVAWLPARLVTSTDWFAEATGVWLNGGPFPAFALTSLMRTDRGMVSQGLGYFGAQDFVLTGRDGGLRESDARAAVRLTDWLVAHGMVESACDIELSGFGTVHLALDGQNGLIARTL